MSANTSKAEAAPEAPAIRTIVAPYAYSVGQSYFQKFTATNNTFCLFGFTALPPWTAVVPFLRCFAVRKNSKLKIGHGCPILSTSAAKCVNSRPTSQAEAKNVVPVVRIVVAPPAYSAVVRVVVPTAAAYDAVRA